MDQQMKVNYPTWVSGSRPKQVFVVTITLKGANKDSARKLVFNAPPTQDQIREALLVAQSYYTDYCNTNKVFLRALETPLNISTDCDGWSRQAGNVASIDMISEDFFQLP